MASAETPAEIFKRALAHAARALAEQSELEVPLKKLAASLKTINEKFGDDLQRLAQ